MAIDDYVPTKPPLSAISTSSSSSSLSSPNIERQRLTQVATENSSSFVQFPTNLRRSSLFVPITRPRTSLSSTPPSTLITDNQSISNNSKSSNAPSSTTTSDDHKRRRSQHGFNPILNNPLLNHRKEQPKPHPISTPPDFSHTMRLYRSARTFKTITKNNKPSTIHQIPSPLLAHHTECNSNKPMANPNHQEVEYCDKNKYDYIKRWLKEVRLAVCPPATLSKKRFVQF
jgi:hypothetical protein